GRWKLRRREYELLADHGGEWAGPLVGRVARWQVRRGFVAQVKLSAGQFLKEARWLMDFVPPWHRQLPRPHPAGLPPAMQGSLRHPHVPCQIPQQPLLLLQRIRHLLPPQSPGSLVPPRQAEHVGRAPGGVDDHGAEWVPEDLPEQVTPRSLLRHRVPGG